MSKRFATLKLPIDSKAQKELKAAIRASRKAKFRPTVIALLYTKLGSISYFATITTAECPFEEKPIQGGIEAGRDKNDISAALLAEVEEEVGLVLTRDSPRIQKIGTPFLLEKQGMQGKWRGKKYWPVLIEVHPDVLSRPITLELDQKTGQLKITGFRWLQSFPHVEMELASLPEEKRRELLPLIAEIYFRPT